MKNTLVFIGAFVATSVVMTGFEFTNHLMYPFPEGLDTTNLIAIHQFGLTMPTFAFVMILLGWFFGTILGVWILNKYLVVKSEVVKVKVIYGFAVLLTALAIINNFMYVGLGNRLWFEVLTVPFFILVAYLTLKFIKNT
jgi:hypothetical protein